MFVKTHKLNDTRREPPSWPSTLVMTTCQNQFINCNKCAFWYKIRLFTRGDCKVRVGTANLATFLPAIHLRCKPGRSVMVWILSPPRVHMLKAVTSKWHHLENPSAMEPSGKEGDPWSFTLSLLLGPKPLPLFLQFCFPNTMTYHEFCSFLPLMFVCCLNSPYLKWGSLQTWAETRESQIKLSSFTWIISGVLSQWQKAEQRVSQKNEVYWNI